MPLIVLERAKLYAKIDSSYTRISALGQELGYRDTDPDFCDTPILSPDTLLTKLNPSVIFIEEHSGSCVFLMSYRAFYPRGGCTQREEYPRSSSPKRTKGKTAWDFGWSCLNAEWEGTGMAIISISRDGVIQVRRDFINVTSCTDVIDARLCSLNSDGNVNMYFNHYIAYPEFPLSHRHLRNKEDEELCVTFKKVTLDCDFNFLSKTVVVCPKVHKIWEKNWAPVEGEYGTYQYSFLPQVTWVYTKGGGISRRVPKSDFFQRLVTYRSSYFPEEFGVSCSTQLLIYSDTEYLGVGHVKVFWKKFPKLFRNFKKREMHPCYAYFMFFYTITKRNMRLGRFSHAFIPQSDQLGYKCSLVMPMSIQNCFGESYVVSLGLSDMDCGFYIGTRRSIEKMLILDNCSHPRDMEFTIN